MFHDRSFQVVKLDAFAYIGSHFDRMNAQAFQRVQRPVEGRRFHQHAIPWACDRRQAEVQRFPRAVGQDDIVRVNVNTDGEVALRDLALQVGKPSRSIELDRAKPRRPAQLSQWKESRTGLGRPPWNKPWVHGRLQKLDRQVAAVKR